MNVLLAASALLVLRSPAGPTSKVQAVPQLTVDVKDGDTISGEKDIRVTVASSDPINQVEFYVGDELRDTETSTPYTFALDTVDQPDGDIKVRFKAYSVQSKTAQKSMTLHIDNLKAKGADFHVQAGLDLLTDSKFKDAQTQGRIALSIDPQSLGAKIVLARSYLGQKTFDKAQKYAEDASTQDPKNAQALRVLAATNVQRAFSTFSKQDSDQTEVVTTIGEALAAAVAAERKALDLQVDALGAATDSNALQVADAANDAERYSLTVSTLQHRVEADPKNTKFVDRLAYALLRSGRYQDALNLLTQSQLHGSPDAYSNAVLAIVLLQTGKTTEAQQAMKSAIEADPDNLGVRTAQAFFALKQNKTAVLASLSADLAKDQGQRVSVNYFLMSLSDRQQHYSAGRKAFERAVLAEPAYPDIYIEQADNSVSGAFATGVDSAQKDRSLALAKMYYNTALVARPEACDALAGLALVGLIQGDKAAAVKFGEASRDASPDSAIGHYAVAAAYQAAGRSTDAHGELDRAIKLDPSNLEGRPIPDTVALWKYLIAGGRIPVISLPQG